jgi:5-methylcytosine-specific restriction endonuclease McrA
MGSLQSVEYRRNYRETHREEAHAAWAVYYAAHREERAAYGRAWVAANRQKVLDSQRAWRASRREEHLARRRALYQVHAEELRAKRRAYGEAHRKEEAARDAAYLVAHPEIFRANARRRRARLAGLVRHATLDQIAARWAMWGGKCWMCGATATCTDHVKPLSRGGSDLAANLRPACKPCNSRKATKWPIGAAA